MTLDRSTAPRLVGWGLFVWLVVLLAVRRVGHVLLDPANPLLVAGFFAATVPLMALVTYPVYRVLGIPRGDRPVAAIVLSLPGMALDVGVVLGAGVALPAMETASVVTFGAILLFGYAVVLLTGIVPRPH